METKLTGTHSVGQFHAMFGLCVEGQFTIGRDADALTQRFLQFLDAVIPLPQILLQLLVFGGFLADAFQLLLFVSYVTFQLAHLLFFERQIAVQLFRNGFLFGQQSFRTLHLLPQQPDFRTGFPNRFFLYCKAMTF